MENTPSHTTVSPIGKIRNRFAGHVPADDDSAIRIVAASTRNWPELTSLGIGEIVLGHDSLIRFALWSASKCCATLLGTRRATLLVPDGDSMWEIRCLVMANASLTTPRPLSGFLLKPVEFLDARASRGAKGARRTLGDSRHRADETCLALLDAFPVGNDGEIAPTGGALSP